MLVTMKKWALILMLCFASFTHSMEVITLVSDPYPPYVQGDESTGAISGSAIDKVNLIFSHIPGVTVKYRIRPWVRALIEVQEGSADGVLQISFKEERLKDFAFTKPYITGTLNLYYNRFKYPKGIQWQALNDLSQYSFGTVLGYYYSKEWSEAEKNGVIVSSQLIDAENLIQFILLDRVDIILLNQQVAKLKLSQFEAEHKIIPITPPLKTYTWHMAFSKRTQAQKLIPEINKVIKMLKLRGEL